MDKVENWTANLIGYQSDNTDVVYQGSENAELVANTVLSIDGGKTALHLAAEHGHHVGLRIILEKAQQAGLQDDAGRTALHLATRNGHVQVVQELLQLQSHTDMGLDVNTRDQNGMTALHIAAANGHQSIIGMLLADPNIDLTARVGG